MSFILDALRKSERERQREATGSLSRAPLAPVRHHVPPWTWLLIALLSLALIALAAAWWQSNRPLAQASPPIETEAAAPEAAPFETREPPAIETESAAPQTVRPISDLNATEPGLPEYRLDLIAYNSQDPGQGSAWINGRRYYVGERIGSGPVLIEVRSDSVVLERAGAQYLLTTR